MSDISTIMKDRRSIRKYKKDPIRSQMLKQLMESVQCTQSWNNSQCWELVLVEDPSIKESIQKAVPAQNPAFHAVTDAPLLIVLCARQGVSGKLNDTLISKPGDWFMFDAGLATQNLCNCAHDLGLGTVVVGWLDHDEVKHIVGLPEDHEVVALIPVGHPDHKGNSPARKAIHEFVHKDRFGNVSCGCASLSGI